MSDARMSDRSTEISLYDDAGSSCPVSALRVLDDSADERATSDSDAHLPQARTGVAMSRLFVRDLRGAIVPIPLAQIVRLEAEDDYVAVITRTRRYLIAARIGELARELPASSFLRLHRSHVVNLDFVDRFVPFDAKRLEVRLRDGSCLVASRSASEMIRRWAR